MKPNFTLEDLARAMIGRTDHSDIRQDWSGYDYSVVVSDDGSLGHGVGCQTFEVSFDFTPDFWDGINQEEFLHNQELLEKGWYSCIEDPGQLDSDIDTLLCSADAQENLKNPNFRSAAEVLFDEICEWLSLF